MDQGYIITRHKECPRHKDDKYLYDDTQECNCRKLNKRDGIKQKLIFGDNDYDFYDSSEDENTETTETTENMVKEIPVDADCSWKHCKEKAKLLAYGTYNPLFKIAWYCLKHAYKVADGGEYVKTCRNCGCMSSVN